MSHKGPPHWRTKSTPHLHAVPPPPDPPAPPYDWWDPAKTNEYWRAKERREAAEKATKIPAGPAAAAWQLQHEREYRLERHLSGLHRANEIRAYVAEARRLLAEYEAEPPDAERSELPVWLAWCEEHASRLDPFSQMRRHMARLQGRDRVEKRAGEDAARDAMRNVLGRQRTRKPTK